VGSVVPVYAGHFHVEIVADDGICGFYMLSQAAVPTMAERRSFPRIGVPIIPEGSNSAFAVLPELPGEFIGSGLVILFQPQLKMIL
jgi:hypothetical protein